jgi:hypothetical protein
MREEVPMSEFIEPGGVERLIGTTFGSSQGAARWAARWAIAAVVVPGGFGRPFLYP